LQNPSLVPPPSALPPFDGGERETDYIPWGPNLPTLLPFRNNGKREALVQQVILSGGKWVPTPQRRNIAGAGRTIRVTFERRHYIKKDDKYLLKLSKPAAIPGDGQWTVMEISLVDPDRVGKTFVGKATLIFDGVRRLEFRDVQLDVLKQAPEKTPED
jgi:hypothetical protein